MSVDTPQTERAFVLGLDGVPWEMLRDWAEAGELPNFARLFEEGAAGPLESTTPATTALAWPSIATGVWPDKHGIYSFQKLTPEYTHRMNTSTEVQQPELWDIIAPSVVANVPMTYPAERIDGKLVGGMMTPEMNDRFTHPPELGREIQDRIPDYRIGLRWNDYHGKEEEFTRDHDSLLSARRELMRMLMEEDWRLFFFVYTEPDRLQHLRWEDDVLLDHYEKLDDILGEVMAYVEEHDANLFVPSDHGFGPISKMVSVNTILDEEGYLTRKEESGTRGTLERLGVTRDRVSDALGSVGIDEHTIVNRLPRGLVDSVAEQLPGGHALYDVDYSKTAAFVHGDGNLYVNDQERFDEGVVHPGKVGALKAELTELFESYTDPETGESVFEVADGETLFPTDERSPDLVLETADGYEKRTTLTDEVFTDPKAMSAAHRPEGILLAWGPDIEAGATPTDASVVDVAPTVLHSLGEPIPANTDGRVLSELFAPTSPASTTAVETADYRTPEATADDGDDRDDFGDVEDRLKGLGYME